MHGNSSPLGTRVTIPGQNYKYSSWHHFHYSQVNWWSSFTCQRSLMGLRNRVLELSFNSSWHLVGSWLFCLQTVHVWYVFGACVEVVWRFEQRTYIGSWRAKLILAPLGTPKWVWSSMNWYRMLFVQTSTLPPRMHHKHTKHGRFCKQNNELPTKSHVELEDNSIVTLVPNEEEFPHRCKAQLNEDVI